MVGRWFPAIVSRMRQTGSSEGWEQVYICDALMMGSKGIPIAWVHHKEPLCGPACAAVVLESAKGGL